MPELVLYGIREQFLGSILDIEVDQSGSLRVDEAGH